MVSFDFVSGIFIDKTQDLRNEKEVHCPYRFAIKMMEWVGTVFLNLYLYSEMILLMLPVMPVNKVIKTSKQTHKIQLGGGRKSILHFM